MLVEGIDRFRSESIDDKKFRRGIVGHIPKDLPLRHHRLAVRKSTLGFVDGAIDRSVAIQESIAKGLPFRPQDTEFVIADLHELGIGNLNVIPVRVIGQPIQRNTVSGKIILFRCDHKNITLTKEVDRSILQDGISGNQIVAARDLHAAHAGTGIVITGLSNDIQQVHIFWVTHIIIPGGTVIPEQHNAAGIGIAMVNGDDILTIHLDELVEGMADVAASDPGYTVTGIGYLHIRGVHTNAQIGLVVQAVGTLEHSVGRADIKMVPAVAHPQTSRPESSFRVDAVKADTVQPLPVMGVFHNTNYLRIGAFASIIVTEHKVIAASIIVETTENRKLTLQLNGGKETQVGAVILNMYGAVIILGDSGGIFHPHVAAIIQCLQVGINDIRTTAVTLRIFIL